MSEAGDSTHKRSKSAALSILRRKDRSAAASSVSGAGTGDEDAASEDGSSFNAPPSAIQSGRDLPTIAYQNAPPPSASSASNPVAIKRHVSRVSGTGASLTGRSPSSVYGASPGRPGAVPPPPSSFSTTSPSSTLEQSVRKFRIVEALRSGDTAYITKAIRETADGAARPSISSTATAATAVITLEDTTVLHLAIQCAEFPVVEYVLSDGAGVLDVNARDKDGNTALHLAAAQGRTQVVRLLLEQKDINDALPNAQGRLPLDVARNPEIFQLLQLSRSLFAERKVNEVQDLIARCEYKTLAQVLEEPRLKTVLDINSTEFASDPVTIQNGGTLLHEAARRKNTQLIQVLLLHGADPFRRDRRGKLPQDVTKDDVTRAMLKKSPAAVAAQRGIQEKAVLGAAAQGGLGYGSGSMGGAGGASSSALGGGAAGAAGVGSGSSASAAGSSIGGLAAGGPSDPLAGREAREMKGYLKKWTNYRKGYQLRWFVLEDGVLSYYKHQDDAGSACRGAINMRIARLNMSADEKTKFEIIGKSSVKYTLKANHEVEAKRWFWALNNSIQWTKDQAKEEERQRARSAELLRQAKADHTLQPQATSQSHLTTSSQTAVSVNNDGESVSGAGPRSSVQLSRITSAAQRSVSHKALVTAGGVGASTAGSIDDDMATNLGGGEFADAIDNGKGIGGADDDDIADDDEDLDNSSGRDHDAPSATRDALNITAQSARLQLETMAQVNQALVSEASRNPTLTLADTSAALTTYDAAIRSLTGLIGDLMRISRDRDAFWQYRLDREVEMRRMWEESMAQVAREQEALEARVGAAEEKKKTAKRILKEVINNGMLDDRPGSGTASPHLASGPSGGILAGATAAAAISAAAASAAAAAATQHPAEGTATTHAEGGLISPSGNARSPSIYTTNTSRRQTVIDQVAAAGLSDSDDDDEDEFFDAVDAGEVPVETRLPSETIIDTKPKAAAAATDEEEEEEKEDAFAEAGDGSEIHKEKAIASAGGEIVVPSGVDISKSFKGYENGIRHRLKIDADNRPKLSLWSILKSMVGKDMTKMTLPVTFNEPTSLLYRCGEDMEYVDLLDQAVERSDSIERLIYVAAFAASEYASTIGRVAKPFNPLLGETFEYVRPDKNYRFFIEQVSHHPPVGAAWAESPHWTYYGESAVKSKFYGKSFDINPLGTWFLKLRPKHGGKEDFFTWKKVTSSVIGIITGNPTVDNYGVMEIKNWTTGEVAYVDFKPRGWTAASAYVISGKIVDASGRVRVSLGGRWNSKMYARMTPGYQTAVHVDGAGQVTGDRAGDVVSTGQVDPSRVFLIWQANERPKGIPFNLTPFVLTFNDINEQLRPWIAPTDSRLRPDQRAMEEGEYDFAATEKNRLETEQRSRRRDRETLGEEFVPAWFEKAKCPITGEAYWQFNGKYWDMRDRAGQGDTSVWDNLEPLFVSQPGKE
ncbi:hypothetical protein SCUCBS95973_007301 [Sporothrix curviconia]|uniref:PH domain-containing protein n=1 Tax=Sporothrix curviconia TaxID=1260050 RepID=A0ABP0CF14_9PEZI